MDLCYVSCRSREPLTSFDSIVDDQSINKIVIALILSSPRASYTSSFASQYYLQKSTRQHD
jgi:hypothetical protein